MGSSYIYDACKIIAPDQEIDGSYEVGFVNPANKLGAGSLSAAKPMANQTQKCVEHASTIRTESHGAAYRHFTGGRHCGREEGCLPGFRDVNRKVPGIR